MIYIRTSRWAVCQRERCCVVCSISIDFLSLSFLSRARHYYYHHRRHSRAMITWLMVFDDYTFARAHYSGFQRPDEKSISWSKREREREYSVGGDVVFSSSLALAHDEFLMGTWRRDRFAIIFLRDNCVFYACVYLSSLSSSVRLIFRSPVYYFSEKHVRTGGGEHVSCENSIVRRCVRLYI